MSRLELDEKKTTRRATLTELLNTDASFWTHNTWQLKKPICTHLLSLYYTKYMCIIEMTYMCFTDWLIIVWTYPKIGRVAVKGGAWPSLLSHCGPLPSLSWRWLLYYTCNKKHGTHCKASTLYGSHLYICIFQIKKTGLNHKSNLSQWMNDDLVMHCITTEKQYGAAFICSYFKVWWKISK